MKRRFLFLLTFFATCALITSCGSDDNKFDARHENSTEIDFDDSRKILVAYFSGTGNTQRLATQIAEAANADVFRITAKEPYSANPYDDSDRIRQESYNDLRPEAADYPDSIAQYDVIFIGSPIWWHNPAMVVCTFLEHYDLSDRIIIPFFTYGSTTYLQDSLDKIYEVTPESAHLATYNGGSIVEWLREINIIE